MKEKSIGGPALESIVSDIREAIAKAKSVNSYVMDSQQRRDHFELMRLLDRAYANLTR
jgi:hypothetical protein